MHVMTICSDGDCKFVPKGITYDYALEVLIPDDDALFEVAKHRIANFLKEIHVIGDRDSHYADFCNVIEHTWRYFEYGYPTALDWHFGGNRYITIERATPI